MALPESPLTGAWELVSDTHIGVAIFTDRHFTMMAAETNRPPFASEHPTDTEAAAAFRTLQAAAGSYEIVGGAVLFHRSVNRHPSWTGQDFRWEFHIDGNRVQLGVWEWRRAALRAPIVTTV